MTESTNDVPCQLYGFMSPSSRIPLQRIRELICRLYEILCEQLTEPPPRDKKPWVCAHCGGHIHWYKFTPPRVGAGYPYHISNQRSGAE